MHKNTFTKGKHLGKELDEIFLKDAYWQLDSEIAHAFWNLLPICSLDNTNDLGAMVSDFISRVLLHLCLLGISFGVTHMLESCVVLNS